MRIFGVGLLCAVGFSGTAAMAAPGDGCSGYYYFADQRKIASVTRDAAGTEKNRKITTVRARPPAGGAYRATLSVESFDARGTLLRSGTSEARCQDGDLLLDLTAGLPTQKGRLNAAAPVLLRYPADMRVGQALESRVAFDLDGETKGKAMKVGFSLADRRVAGAKEVDTPVGRRSAFVITSVLNVSFRVVGIAIPMRFDLTEYFVPGFGVVGSKAAQKGKTVEESDIRFVSGR